jgi:hypothetical protein
MKYRHSIPLWRTDCGLTVAITVLIEAPRQPKCHTKRDDQPRLEGPSQPDLFCETPVGGGIDSPLYAWVAETLRSLLPQLTKMEILFGELAGIETLESRLREAVVAARSQIGVSGQIWAWART